MNILYIGNHSGARNAAHYYKTPQKLGQGFIRNGHCFYVFNDKEEMRGHNPLNSSRLGRGKMNRRVLEIVKTFRPELIILGHCEQLLNGTLAEIREILPETRIIYRNVDPLSSPQNAAEIRGRVGHVDGIFITSAGRGLQQFADPKTFVCFMPNLIDPSIETGAAFKNPHPETDVFFAGAFLRDVAHDHRQEAVKRLQPLLDQKGIIHDFRGSNLDDRLLYGRAYLDKLAATKIGLCLNKKAEDYLYSSARMAQTQGQGALAAISRDSGFADLFGEDEMIFYDDVGELADKITFYAQNDKAWREAAGKSHEKAHRLFNNQTICRYIEERSFDKPLSQDYIWPTIVY